MSPNTQLQKHCEAFRLEISSHVLSLSLILASSTAVLVNCTGDTTLRQLDQHAQLYIEKLQSAETDRKEQQSSIERGVSTALQWQEAYTREWREQSTDLNNAVSALPQSFGVGF